MVQPNPNMFPKDESHLANYEAISPGEIKHAQIFAEEYGTKFGAVVMIDVLCLK